MDKVGLPFRLSTGQQISERPPKMFDRFPVEALKCKHLQGWSLKAEHIMVPVHLQISPQRQDPELNGMAQDPGACPLWRGI